MTNTMQFFVVFHNKIFDECYKKIPPDVLKTYFTFFAVNKSIPKCYTPNTYKILNEWDLPIYDPTMQEKGYRENSAIYHIYANGIHKQYDRIGFFQYDMLINENIVEKILSVPVERPIGFYVLSTHIIQFVESANIKFAEQMKHTVSLYERHFSRKVLTILKSRVPPFKTTWDKTCKYPLLNSYVIQNHVFERIMKWVIQLYPIPDFQEGTAFLYEGIMAIALGCEDLEWRPLDIVHDQDFKKPCY